MAVSYKKLWKLLIDKEMMKKDLLFRQYAWINIILTLMKMKQKQRQKESNRYDKRAVAST